MTTLSLSLLFLKIALHRSPGLLFRERPVEMLLFEEIGVKTGGHSE
jgi:hypothetical protein